MPTTKIIWCIDALGDKAQQLKVLKVLKAFTHGSTAVIEPVCVLSPDQLRVPASAFGSHHEEYKLEAEKTLKSWLKNAKTPQLLPPTLLVSQDYSKRGSVQTLIQYAKDSGARLIALNTRSRKGILRYLLGSFAEDLLLHCNIPLLTINPHVKPGTKIKEIFFPTDLGKTSESAFEMILGVAKLLKAKITLYHKVEYLVPETYSMIYQTPVYDKYLEQDTTDRKKTLDRWVEKAKSQGVKATPLFDAKPSFVGDSLLKQAKKTKGLVAMASHSGPLATAILGSVARQVIRESSEPVWVVHI